jgi:hypothetical protein
MRFELDGLDTNSWVLVSCGLDERIFSVGVFGTQIRRYHFML